MHCQNSSGDLISRN